MDQFAASSTPILVFDRGGTPLYRNESAEPFLEAGDAPELKAEAARLTPALPSPRTIQQRLGITPRQAEVARLIARGLTSAEVAEELGISVHTVRRHTEAILSRLELRSRSGVAARLMSVAPTS